MAPKWSDDLNFKFVQLYKEQRCLWDQQDALYKDKNSRDSALIAIAENLNIPGFGTTEVKAKIKAFRGTFNIELAKQQKSAKSGSGSCDVYVPTLKWFDAMKEVMSRGTLTRTSTTTLDEDIEEDVPVIPIISPACSKLSGRKRKREDIEFEEISPPQEQYRTTPDLTKNVVHRQHAELDETVAFSVTVASKLRRMKEDQRLVAELLVTKVMYYGMTGRLSELSTISLGPPTTYCQTQLHDHQTTSSPCCSYSLKSDESTNDVG